MSTHGAWKNEAHEDDEPPPSQVIHYTRFAVEANLDSL
jgi:hypothetical protein